MKNTPEGRGERPHKLNHVEGVGLRHEEYTLLCETCGYVVDGLPADGPCPECGRSVRSSQPEARKGTAWQRNRGLATWLQTGWATLRHPRRTFDGLRVDPVSLGPLLVRNALTASALATAPLWVASATQVHRWLRRDVGAGASVISTLLAGVLWFVFVLGITWFVGFIAVNSLTLVERAGLRTIGRWHRWRITPAIADSVCSQSSYGWIIAGMSFGVAISFVLFAEPRDFAAIFGNNRWQEWALGLVTSLILGGLLVFETLVYIGVRRCKFANRAREAEPSPSRDAATAM